MRIKRQVAHARWSGRRIGRAAVAAALTLFVGWWAVKIAVVNAMVRANPFAAAAVAPSDPRSAIELAMIEFALRGGHVAPAAERRALEALDRSSLADEPFLLAGVAAAAHGDAARAEALLIEARRRNPRGRMARLILLDRYLRTGRADEAGTELAVLARLIPEAGGAIAPQLTQLAVDPRTRPSVARILRRNPVIRDAVLANLAGGRSDPALVLALASETGSGRNPTAPPAWQKALLSSLIARGDVERAYKVWRATLGGVGRPDEKGVYDGSFRGAPGAPPFNWDLASGPEGIAERTPAPALQVDYYGRSDLILARQLLILRPGQYRMQLRAQGAAKGEGTHLTWSIACAGAASELMQLPLKDIASAPRTLSATFAVPSGCPAQWLKLKGVAGDVAAEQIVAISDVELVAASAK